MGNPIVVELVVSYPPSAWTCAGRGGGEIGCVRRLLGIIRKTSEYLLQSFISEEMSKRQNPVMGVEVMVHFFKNPNCRLNS